jgi:peptidylprolyl isomerase
VSSPKPGRLALIRYTIYAVDNGNLELVETTEKEVAEKHGAPEKLVEGPRPVIIGKSKLIDAVEEALESLEEGQEIEIEAPPEKAYGLRDESKIVRVPIKQLRRSGIQPVVGREVSAGGRRGRIVRVTERFAYIDFNHPLAGKKLKIWLKLDKILKTPEEKAGALAKRWLGLEPRNVHFENGVLTLELPPELYALRDLDSKMALMLQDLIDSITNLSEIKIISSIKISGEEEESSKESGGEHEKQSDNKDAGEGAG